MKGGIWANSPDLREAGRSTALGRQHWRGYNRYRPHYLAMSGLLLPGRVLVRNQDDGHPAHHAVVSGCYRACPLNGGSTTAFISPLYR